MYTAKKLDLGEYEYRGFVITDTGGDRSLGSRMNRHSSWRWSVTKLDPERPTLPSFAREKTRHSAPTLADAKRRIDAALTRHVAEEDIA